MESYMQFYILYYDNVMLNYRRSSLFFVISKSRYITPAMGRWHDTGSTLQLNKSQGRRVLKNYGNMPYLDYCVGDLLVA